MDSIRAREPPQKEMLGIRESTCTCMGVQRESKTLGWGCIPKRQNMNIVHLMKSPARNKDMSCGDRLPLKSTGIHLLGARYVWNSSASPLHCLHEPTNLTSSGFARKVRTVGLPEKRLKSRNSGSEKIGQWAAGNGTHSTLTSAHSTLKVSIVRVTARMCQSEPLKLIHTGDRCPQS